VTKRFFILFGVGILLVAGGVFSILYSNKGSHLVLKEKILKVRTGALSDQDSILVLDLRLENTSDVPFVVRQVEVSIDKADGSTSQASIISKMDVHQVFQFNRFLGDQFNDTLSMKDKVAPHATIDRMVAARFDVPIKDLDGAKLMHLSIQDLDGPYFEISQSLK
jgi:hypothetical protein